MQRLIFPNESNCDEPSVASTASVNTLALRCPWLLWLRFILLLSGLLGGVTLCGCLTKQNNELVVYSALDREFSQPVLNDLGELLQMQVRVKYDQESNKTVGLATELIQTQQNPKADIFWNNEILHTLRLERLGLLAPITEADLSRFPKAYRSPRALVRLCGAGQGSDCEYRFIA